MRVSDAFAGSGLQGPAEETVAEQEIEHRWQTESKISGDYVFKAITLVMALSIIAILLLMLYEMVSTSKATLAKFGLDFITGRDWDVVQENFGALAFIFGSIVTSVLALAIATPLSVGTAVFISEVAPRKIGSVIGALVELLAAIPSVIFGLWGVLVMAPWLQSTLQPFLAKHLGFLPFFQGPAYGVGILAAVIILTIMIIPIITSLTKEVLAAVPQSQREAAIGIGATKWEMIRIAVLPYGKSGILGAVILGLGRAIGETMAVTMVIGNSPTISWSLFSAGYTMPSVIANEFAEASSTFHSSALMEVGLLLLIITLVINVLARLLLWGMNRNQAKGFKI